MTFDSLDIIEVLKFCILGSVVGLCTAVLLLFFIYKLFGFLVDLKSLQKRFDFLEEVFSDDIKKFISNKLSK